MSRLKHTPKAPKYSQALLDEAARLMQTMKCREVAKITGVNIWVIKKHARKLRREGRGFPRRDWGPNGRPMKYTPEQKRACIILATTLQAAGRTRQQAYIQAGRQTGVNGSSIEYQVFKGGEVAGVPDYKELIQQTLQSLGASGFSNKTYKPQATPWSRQ